MTLQKLFLIVVYSITPWALYAQGVIEYYQNKSIKKPTLTLRAGLNYSQQSITAYDAGNNAPISVLWGVKPKAGFYIGSSYCKDLSPDQLTMRMDATLQMRGVKSIDSNNKLILNANYYYLGVSPQIGVYLTSKIIVYTGVEANILVAKKNSWGEGALLDVGTPMRINYVFGPVKLELAYVWAFTSYDRLKDVAIVGGPFQHDFYNRNWQLGLVYRWNK